MARTKKGFSTSLPIGLEEQLEAHCKKVGIHRPDLVAQLVDSYLRSPTAALHERLVDRLANKEDKPWNVFGGAED